MGFLEFITIGAIVGLLIGLTGVGGGSIMTPLLLMFGIPPSVAIGTDLLYASITKTSSLVAHYQQKHIQWDIVKSMALGSLPAAMFTTCVLFMLKEHVNANNFSDLLTKTLGVMLLSTAFVLFMRNKIRQLNIVQFLQKNAPRYTISMGIIIGCLVTLSSVGAGAIGTAVLLLLYPALASKHVVGTDVAHAVPLTLIAGLGHLGLGHIDFNLLTGLLIGSIPAAIIGSRFSAKVPDTILRAILTIILCVLGIQFLLN